MFRGCGTFCLYLQGHSFSNCHHIRASRSFALLGFHSRRRLLLDLERPEHFPRPLRAIRDHALALAGDRLKVHHPDRLQRAQRGLRRKIHPAAFSRRSSTRCSSSAKPARSRSRCCRSDSSRSGEYTANRRGLSSSRPTSTTRKRLWSLRRRPRHHRPVLRRRPLRFRQQNLHGTVVPLRQPHQISATGRLQRRSHRAVDHAPVLSVALIR